MHTRDYNDAVGCKRVGRAAFILKLAAGHHIPSFISSLRFFSIIDHDYGRKND